MRGVLIACRKIHLIRDNQKRIIMTATDSSSPDNKKQKCNKAALFEGDDLWDKSWKETDGEKTLKKRMMNPGEEGSATDPAFVLYGSWFCPFAQRAWIAAEESKANYQWVEINPYYVNPNQPGGYTKKAMSIQEKQAAYPGFVEASPRGLVPAIQHKDIHLWESLPVSEYIDRVFGDDNLMQRHDPYLTAKQQIWCNHCTDRVQKKYYQALTCQEKDKQNELVQEFYKECRSLANAMSNKNGGNYFDGDQFSMVDVCLAPFWQRFVTVGRDYFNLTFPMEEPEFQRLDKWWTAVKNRPSVSNTICCEPRLVATYSDYSRNVATSDAARNYFK